MTVRIGVNALYLIPGGVGGTEIYLRELLAALAAIDSTNEYLIFTNRETGFGLGASSGKFRMEAAGGPGHSPSRADSLGANCFATGGRAVPAGRSV